MEMALMTASVATAARSEASRRYTYPINEVMLKTLVCSGKSGEEIAEFCLTTPAAVAHMREEFGV